MAINDSNVVNELFWANFAAEKIYDSFDTRAKAVTNLQAFIQWVLTLFSGSGIILVFFVKGQFTSPALFIWGIGFAFFVVAYYYASSAGFPVSKEMDPNEAKDIARAYTAAVSNSESNFKLAQRWTILGVFLIATGILVQFGSAGYPQPEQKKNAPVLRLNASLQKDGKNILVPLIVRTIPSGSTDIRISASDTFISNRFLLQGDTSLGAITLNADTGGIATGLYAAPEKINRKYLVVTAITGKAVTDSNYAITSQKIPLPK